MDFVAQAARYLADHHKGETLTAIMGVAIQAVNGLMDCVAGIIVLKAIVEAWSHAEGGDEEVRREQALLQERIARLLSMLPERDMIWLDVRARIADDPVRVLDGAALAMLRVAEAAAALDCLLEEACEAVLPYTMPV